MNHKNQTSFMFKLFVKNDTQTVIDKLYPIQNKPKNAIIHSDHDLCYLSLI